MYEKLLKSILYLWGFVFLVFGVKFMISNSATLTKMPQNIWDEVSTFAIDLAKGDTIKMVLIKKYGMTIEGVSLCQDDKNATVKDIDNPSISTISSSCWNGDCKVSLSFKDKVPKKIKLNVQLPYSNNCLIETYDAARAVQVVGYKGNLIITDALKETLGLQSGDEKIKFKHQTGYTRSKVNGNIEMTFDFDELPSSDLLMVDGKEKLTVDFTVK